MTQKRATAVDTHIGHRMRTRRQIMGLSQETMADKLGITFQQVQKYEKGTNRISASRLRDVAAILDVSVGHFFEGFGGAGSAEDGAVEDIVSDREGMALLRAFYQIQDAAIRRALVDLAQSIHRSVA
jgi:transcriptional regulator with XRE-family HTH domain